MKRMRVLICGAGVAGTAIAYWLRRFGFDVSVVERAPAPRDGGYKVDIRGAAVDVVRRMGLLDELRRLTTDMRTATQYNDAGKAVSVLDADLFGGRHDGDLEVMRGSLTRTLYDATSDTVAYRFGDTITAAEQTDRGVTVTFASGKTDTFDVLVGADGMRSETRSLCFGAQEAAEEYLGHYISVYAVPNLLGLDREEAVHLAPGRTVNVYATAGSSDARALFLFASPKLDVEARNVERQKEILAEAMRDVAWETPKLLSHLAGADDFYFDALTRIRLPAWTSGRIALVGDAAYCATPASGQGTSLALVGAYVLAGELAVGGELPEAFAAYETKLRPFVEANQKLADGNLRGMVVGSRFAVRMQQATMRILPYIPGHRSIIGRVADTINAAATAIQLGDYEMQLR